MEGYNIGLQLGSKTMLGRTQDDLTVSARVKESLTKDDQGDANSVVTGHDVTFKCSGLLMLNGSGETAQMDRDDVLGLVFSTGDNAELSFTYSVSGGKTMTGGCIITGYSESSSASGEEDATISLDLKVIGSVTIS